MLRDYLMGTLMVGTPLQLMMSTNIGKVRAVKLLALSRFPDVSH